MTTEKESKLPVLNDGDIVTFVNVSVQEKKTKPPVRYTEGTLLDDMQAAGKYVNDPELKKVLKSVSGLGTAATRAAIFETLKGHKYVEKKGKNFVPTEKGMKFINWIEDVCPELVDVAETARWEAQLEVVSQKGGGLQFEQAIAQKVKRIIAILQTANGINPNTQSTTSTQNNSENSMTDVSKPSEKQLTYAQNIATRLGLKLNDEIINDRAACSAFIDQHSGAANAPTEKQIAFASRIAKDKGVALPDAAMKDKKQLSAWIDENK